MDRSSAGTGYLAVPDSGSGPGVLVLHAWWGLNDFFRELCDRLAAEGFVALAPDLLGGQVASTPEEAERQLAEASPDELAHLTRSSLATLRSLPATPDGPVGLIGFSMGASMALWVSARVPEGVAATTVFYGAQDMDFSESKSAYLGHFTGEGDDPWVDEDSVVMLEAELRLDELETTFHRYPGTSHWFFEADRPEHDEEAAELAWQRTLSFLRQHLSPGTDRTEG